MSDEKVKHNHDDNDIIIKDHDGSYKILQDGKFVPLSDIESAQHLAEHEQEDHGPKRGTDEQGKKVPRFKAEPQKVEAPKQIIEKPAEESLEQKAERIINKSGVTFASGEVRSRVNKVLVSHIKGIRKPFQTKESLTRSISDGGAGVTQEDADKILAAAGVGSVKGLRPEMDITPTKMPPSPVKPITPVGAEVSTPPKIDAKIETPPALKTEAQVLVAPAVSPKPEVADVKKPARPMMGLASELQYTLADWRRVASNPQDRIKKIENQLGVLEEESFPEKVKGLSAWRSSDVFRMYLEAGEKSLDQGSVLQEILGQGGPDSLSWEEWQSVADLNERIRA